MLQADAIHMQYPTPTGSLTVLRDVSLTLDVGESAAVMGPSGSGKSTLLNSLVGEDIQAVKELAPSGKGLHTTRRRELFVLSTGTMVIDTPGMREIQLWSINEGISETFKDISETGKGCRFSNCSHDKEPDCAVKKAVQRKEISRSRYENFLKMQKEIDFLDSKQDKKAILERKAADKKLMKQIRKNKKK